MHRKTAHGVLLVLCSGIALWVFSAQAATLKKLPNADAKTFTPAPSPYGIINVQTAQMLRSWGPFISLTTNYANDLLVGRLDGDVVDRPIAHRVTMELAVAFNLFRWVDLGLIMPFYAFQRQVEPLLVIAPGETNTSTQFGPGDLRLFAKARLWLDNSPRYMGFGLALYADLGLPTGKKDAFMSARISSSVKLIADWRHRSGFVIALNAGYHYQQRATFGDFAIDDELRFGLGAELPLFFKGFSLLGEVTTTVAIGAGLSNNRDALKNVPVELSLGLRYRMPRGVILTLGSGVGVSPGYATPDVRVFLGLSWGLNTHESPGQHKIRTRVMTVTETHKSKLIKLKHTQRHAATLPTKFEAYRPLTSVQFDKVVINDPDPDGDGIPNSRDKCPYEPEDFDGFEDEDGCPDPDNDRDGIPDKYDKCPMMPETINGFEDDDGCPDKGMRKVSLKGMKIKITERVFFKIGSDVLDPRSNAILKQVASFIKSKWYIRKVRIEGHTDIQGDKDMNVDLGERRAIRVMEFLAKEGVAPFRLTAKGYGTKHPIASNATKEGRGRNRRVEFTVLKISTDFKLAPKTPMTPTPAPQRGVPKK